MQKINRECILTHQQILQGYKTCVYLRVSRNYINHTLKARISYIEFFIATGVLSFLIALILFIVKRGVDDWFTFFLLFLLPSFLTLASFFYVVKTKDNDAPIKTTFNITNARKATFITLSVVVLLFQLFIISAWFGKGANRYFPVVLHFYGYFMLIGSICNLIFLYRLTEPKNKVTTVQSSDAANIGF